MLGAEGQLGNDGGTQRQEKKPRLSEKKILIKELDSDPKLRRVIVHEEGRQEGVY